MKTWVSYLAALAMGFSTCLLFRDSTFVTELFSAISSYLINFSIYLFIPILLITFSAGVASLKKDEAGGKMASSIAGWSISSTVILSVAAAAIYCFFPVKFPVTASAGSSMEALSTAASLLSKEAFGYLYPSNPFSLISELTTFLPPAIIIAWIFGLSLKPSSDVIRPAYTVVNSLAEVMYRISRTVATFGWLLAYTGSTWLFLSLYQEKTVLVAPYFLSVVIFATAFIMLVLLPLLYACYTGFRRNPYKVIFRSLSNLIIALVTGNIITATFIGESVARQNLGAQKRITSTSLPLLTIFSRGGTAFISTLVSLMLIEGATGEIPSVLVCFGVSCAIMLTSFTSSLFVGYESVFVIIFAFKLLSIELGNAEAALIALLPLINGIGVMLDSLIGNMGAVVASVGVGTDMKIPYSDTI